MVKYSEAKKASNTKWDKANLDRISLALPKGYKEELANLAASRGQSVNAFIKEAIDKHKETL